MLRKPIFDAVRELLGRGFTQDEVSFIDRAINEALGQKDEPNACPSRIGTEGVTLIKEFEGCATRRPDGMIQAYPDPGTGGDPWTIGWGATHIEGRQICRDDCISQAQADLLFEEHIESYAKEVAKALGDAPTSQAQFDALVSFHYNTGAIAKATLTKKHCAGDYEGAAREFARWTRAAGRVMNGLVRRRDAECALYKRGC